ncbi:MAG: substrate-binding domain-containing protein [Planctomycetales bacterium]|nr:substrate-binding domain-containing protein [Planctomycetales bacterium]
MSVQEIALAFPRGTHQEVFLEGVLRYAADHDCNWSYITTPESLSLSVLDLAGWPGDGILASINTPEEADFAATLSIPVVNVSSAMAESPVPRSIVDNNAIGVLAAEHLLSKAFPHYAFYGLSGVEYSRRRQQGFTEKLAEAGRASENMYLSMPTFGLRGNSWLNQHRALAEWLASLATPCGLFAVSDYRARQALDACRSINLKVPEQIAVIGVDNETDYLRTRLPSTFERRAKRSDGRLPRRRVAPPPAARGSGRRRDPDYRTAPSRRARIYGDVRGGGSASVQGNDLSS